MKDSVTGKTIVVETDNEYGPYVQVTYYEDYDYLEDELTENYGIDIFAIKPIDKKGEVIAHRIYFGKLADPKLMQKLVNEIEIKKL